MAQTCRVLCYSLDRISLPENPTGVCLIDRLAVPDSRLTNNPTRLHFLVPHASEEPFELPVSVHDVPSDLDYSKENVVSPIFKNRLSSVTVFS